MRSRRRWAARSRRPPKRQPCSTWHSLPSMSEANKAVVRRLWATLYTRDWDAVAALFSDDAFYEDVPTPDPGARGPARS